MRLIPLIVLCAFSLNALAKEKSKFISSAGSTPQLDAEKPVVKKASRRVASVEQENEYSNIRTRSRLKSAEDKDWLVQVGFMTGYASSSTNNTAEQKSRDAGRYDQNIYLGLNADIHANKYFGGELEGFLNLAPTKVSNDFNRINGVTTNVDKSLQQYGGAATFKMQYPIRKRSVRMVPKIGLGYGVFGVRQTEVVVNTDTTTTQLRGPFAMVGFDIAPVADFTIGMDYATSFFGSGSQDRTLGDAATTESTFESSRFERLRVGAYYKIMDPVTIGGQYALRSLNYRNAGDALTTRERFNQFLGVVMVGF